MYLFMYNITERKEVADTAKISVIPHPRVIYLSMVFTSGGVVVNRKTANLELQDIPSKSQVPVSLPLLHLSVTPRAEQQSPSAPPGESKGPYIFQCLCFVSSNTWGQNKTLFTIAVSSTDITPQKWATRNLSCTLRPFWMFKCIVVCMYYLHSTTLKPRTLLSVLWVQLFLYSCMCKICTHSRYNWIIIDRISIYAIHQATF